MGEPASEPCLELAPERTAAEMAGGICSSGGSSSSSSSGRGQVLKAACRGKTKQLLNNWLTLPRSDEGHIQVNTHAALY